MVIYALRVDFESDAVARENNNALQLDGNAFQGLCSDTKVS